MPVRFTELTGQRVVTVPQKGQHPSGPADRVGGRRSGTAVTIRGRLDIAAEAGPAEGGDGLRQSSGLVMRSRPPKPRS